MAEVELTTTSVDNLKVNLKDDEKLVENGCPEEDGGVVTVEYLGPSNDNGLQSSYVKHGNSVVSYTCINDNIVYNLKDCVYIENVQPDQPFYISVIESFELTCDNKLFVHVKWFFRHSEIPYNVYQLLVEDRKNDRNIGREQTKGSSLISRELFVSEATDTYPVSALRGKCQVTQYPDLKTAKEADTELENFFYVLGYHPDTKRLATTQGEIRVGSSHQARLPECKPSVKPSEMPENPADYEELKWLPESVVDGDLMMYLRAARSVAAFAGMCDGGSTEDGCQVASMDETTVNAMDTLHYFEYDTGSALQALIKCPVPRSIEKHWTDDEVKRFVKGMRQFGKNFFKICKELLAHKETGELVEFYYFWKKTQNATNIRSHRRHRGQAGLKKQNTRSQRPASADSQRPASTEFMDGSSASELSDQDSVSDDSDTRDVTGYTCRRCLTTSSKDWHHGGKDISLLCTKCRIFFKKFGEDRPLDEATEPAPFLFRPVKEDEESGGYLADEQPTRENMKNDDNDSSPDTSSPAPENVLDPPKMDNIKTLVDQSMVSDVSQMAVKRLSNIDISNEVPHKKIRQRMGSESGSESSSLSEARDENGNEGDVENNQDDQSSNSSSSIPGTPPLDLKTGEPAMMVKCEEPLNKEQPPLADAVQSGRHSYTPTHFTVKKESSEQALSGSLSPLTVPSILPHPLSPLSSNAAGNASPSNSPLPNPPPLHPVRPIQHPVVSIPYYFPSYSSVPSTLSPSSLLQNYPSVHPPFLPPQVPYSLPSSPVSASTLSVDVKDSIYTASSTMETVTMPTTFHGVRTLTPGLTSSQHAFHKVQPSRTSPLPPLQQSSSVHVSWSSPVSPVAALTPSIHNQSLPPPPPLQPLYQRSDDNQFGSRTPDSSAARSAMDVSIKSEPVSVGYGDEVDDDANHESDQRGTPSPGPAPVVCDRELLSSTNAVFVKKLDRGYNSCCRTDIAFKPPPIPCFEIYLKCHCL